MIDHVAVKSSNIESIGYEPKAQRMEIKFKGGKVYEYHGIDSEEHERFMKAKSAGGHFAAHIRPHYQGKVLDAQPGAQPATGRVAK